MNPSFSIKCMAGLLGICLVSIPLYAQVDDSTQIEQIEPATSRQQTLYPPAQQTPPPSAVQSNQAQTNDQDDFFSGRADGERDGSMVKTGGWFFMGCCLGATGLLITYVIDPTVPPTANIMGKSSKYIMGYNDGYEKAVKKRRVKSAFSGCIVSGVCTVAYYIFAFTLMASSGY